MKQIKIKSRTLQVFTNKTNGKEYVLQGYVACDDYLIPLHPHWNTPQKENWTIEDIKYWEPHYAKRETWIAMSDVDFNDWDLSKEWYDNYKSEAEQRHKEILAKYHSSF